MQNILWRGFVHIAVHCNPWHARHSGSSHTFASIVILSLKSEFLAHSSTAISGNFQQRWALPCNKRARRDGKNATIISDSRRKRGIGISTIRPTSEPQTVRQNLWSCSSHRRTTAGGYGPFFEHNSRRPFRSLLLPKAPQSNAPA
jgi:hypothetical protein